MSATGAIGTIAAALAAAHEKLPGNEARLLLGHIVQQPPAWLLAHGDETLDEAALCAFTALVARRHGGEPVAYLLGRREFFGRDFSTSPAVLIPRPETELLVEIALRKVMRSGIPSDGAGETPRGKPVYPGTDSKGTAEDGRTADNAVRILDLGTGTGCIAVTLALHCAHAHVTAIDASAAALDIARANAHRLDAAVRFLESDWYSAVRGERFDLIVSNPPYIAAADPHLSQGDLRHEPSAALVGGADGLDAICDIIAAAPLYLSAQGQLWLEHGYDQAAAVRALLSAGGFVAIEQHRDLAGIVRVSGGMRGTAA